MKSFINILGVLIAIVLSIVLLVALIVTPVIHVASGITQPETVMTVVENIDYSTLFQEVNDHVTDAVAGSMQAEFTEAFLKTDMAHEALELYVNDLFASLNVDNSAPQAFTPEALQKLAQEHMDELLPIAEALLEEMADSEISVPQEQLEELVNMVFQESAEQIIEMMPSLEDLGLMPEEEVLPQEETVTVAQALTWLHNGQMLKAALLLIGILSVLILLFRFPRFKGFMWLAVVYLLGAAASVLLALGIRNPIVLEMVGTEQSIQTVVVPLLDTLAELLWTSTAIIAACGVLFIIVFSVGRKLLYRR